MAGLWVIGVMFAVSATATGADRMTMGLLLAITGAKYDTANMTPITHNPAIA